jgi:acyl-CoA thioesterase-1
MSDVGTRLIRAVALLPALLAPACDSPLGPERAAPVVRVVVLGDSLAVSPTPENAFPAALQEMFNQKQQAVTLVNASASGSTTADGLRRLDAALAGDVHVLVLVLGANDGLRGIPVLDVERHLAEIITRAQQRSIRVLVCGMDTPPFHGWQYSVDFHQLFPRLAAEYGVPLVPFLLTGVILNPEFLGPDRLHPNAVGARRIAEAIWPYLEPLVASVHASERAGTSVGEGD